MTQANSSVNITQGSGKVIAAHTAASKDHQLFMLADASGHIYGTKPAYIAVIPSQVHVAVQIPSIGICSTPMRR